MGNRLSLAPYPISVAYICENLGKPNRDREGACLGYEKSDFCLGHLEYLLSQLKRGDKRSTNVMVKLCRLNIAMNHLIPIIMYYGDDHTLVMAAVNLLCMVTKHMDMTTVLDHLQAVLPIILLHFDKALYLVQGSLEFEDDWNFVQSVLLLSRDMLSLKGHSFDKAVFRDAPDITALDDKFLEKLFSENLISEMLVLTHYLDIWRENFRNIKAQPTTDFQFASGEQVGRSTFYRVIEFAAAFKGDGNSGSLLPLGKETMKSILTPFSAAAIVAIGTLNAAAAKTDVLEPIAADLPYADLISFSRGLLTAMPYIYVPIGLAGIAISIGASVNGRLMGVASGFMLVQFLHIIFVGALSAFVKTTVHGWIVSLVAILVMLLFVICWGTVCKYPECLSCLVHEPVMTAFGMLTSCWKRMSLITHGSPRAVGGGQSRVTPARDPELEDIRIDIKGEEIGRPKVF